MANVYAKAEEKKRINIAVSAAPMRARTDLIINKHSSKSDKDDEKRAFLRVAEITKRRKSVGYRNGEERARKRSRERENNTMCVCVCVSV